MEETQTTPELTTGDYVFAAAVYGCVAYTGLRITKGAHKIVTTKWREYRANRKA